MKSCEKESVCNATNEMIAKAADDGVETVWDRLEQQLPQCRYGQLGICCRNCAMGPCRINPFGKEPSVGVCGATADVIVARNLLVHISTGAAAHSDHGRDIALLLLSIAEGTAKDYSIRDEKKLRTIASELAIATEGCTLSEIAGEVAGMLLEDFGRQRPGGFPFLLRAPDKRIALWKSLGLIPRGIDREVVESLHRTHMGVDNDATSLLLQGVRTALADGWAGSMVATELSDVIFGTPVPRVTKVNLGVLREDMVNILVHGHELILSEMIVQAANDPRLVGRAEAYGAKGINVCGICCTGNEMLSRKGIPVVGNFLQQELAVVSGAVEAMVVDVQCIFPSMVHLSHCYHTKFISTSSKARFEGAEHIEFDEHNAYGTACSVVEAAVDNFRNRKPAMVQIPSETMEATAGFTAETILGALGGSVAPLVEAIEQGTLRGIVGVVGCNNPKFKHDEAHLVLVKELIKHDILVVSTGCNAIACAKNGLLRGSAANEAGEGLKSLCTALGIPPVLHMGSCVDISRILTIAGALAKHCCCDISDLPIAGAAPEWMSQKAVSIAAYMLGSGVFTVLGVVPPVLGSEMVAGLLCDKIEGVLGAKFAVETDPKKMAELVIHHVNVKRSRLFSGFKVIELETVTAKKKSIDGASVHS